jgi:signal transduction histidine kinase
VVGGEGVALPLVVGDSTYGGDTASSDEIRRALARELHDSVAQTLTAMLIELENFKLEQTGRRSALRQLDELEGSTRDVLTNLRHILYDLRGESGVEEGFADMIRALLARFEARTHVNARLSVSPAWPSQLRSQTALHIYRIVEEALTNVRLHSGAALVEVVLGLGRDRQLAVEVKDDGRGTEFGAGGRAPGLGVLGMRERTAILGGRLEVKSEFGGGTTIRAILPTEQLI